MDPNLEKRPSCEDILRMKFFLSQDQNELKWLKIRSRILQEETKKIAVILTKKETRRKSLF